METSQNSRNLFPWISLGRAPHESQESQEAGKGSPLTGYPATPDRIRLPFLRRKGRVEVGWVRAVSRRHLLSCRKESPSRWSSVCFSSACIAILGGESRGVSGVGDVGDIGDDSTISEGGEGIDKSKSRWEGALRADLPFCFSVSASMAPSVDQSVGSPYLAVPTWGLQPWARSSQHCQDFSLKSNVWGRVAPRPVSAEISGAGEGEAKFRMRSAHALRRGIATSCSESPSCEKALLQTCHKRPHAGQRGLFPEDQRWAALSPHPWTRQSWRQRPDSCFSRLPHLKCEQIAMEGHKHSPSPKSYGFSPQIC